MRYEFFLDTKKKELGLLIKKHRGFIRVRQAYLKKSRTLIPLTPLDQQISIWFTPPFESISAKHKGGVNPSPDPVLGPQNDRFPLRNRYFRVQKPNFFPPAAGQILTRSSVNL